MKRKAVSLMIVVLLSATLVPFAFAQRGMGDPTGVGRQAIKPELVSFSGEVVAVETQPCEKTTGGGRVGTHVTLKTTDGETLNVHLGWADAVEKTASQLAAGKKVEVTAFRTDKMPEKHYVAKSLTFDGKSVQLRDESLRPIWAGGGARSNGLQQPLGSGRGFGRGYGRGRGAGGVAGYGR
jgi:hypothetical protein